MHFSNTDFIIINIHFWMCYAVQCIHLTTFVSRSISWYSTQILTRVINHFDQWFFFIYQKIIDDLAIFDYNLSLVKILMTSYFNLTILCHRDFWNCKNKFQTFLKVLDIFFIFVLCMNAWKLKVQFAR